MKPRILAVIIGIILAAGAGAAVRTHHLDKISLDFDEYLHVFAAKGLQQAGTPALPSGALYTRALPYSRWVKSAMDAFGDSEVAVRLPSIIAGVGLVVLAGVLAARFWGLGALFPVMALVVVDPFCIEMSRVCRMYSSFHLLYLFVTIALFELWEKACNTRQRIAWGAAAAGGLLLGAILHKLMAEVVISFGAYLTLQALLRRRMKYVLPVVLGITAVAAGSALGVVNLGGILQKANSAPIYATQLRYAYDYYIKQFWHIDPWLVVFIVPALITLWRRNTALGVYLLCALFVPFGLHSFIFDWKEARYLLHIVPIALWTVGSAIWLWTQTLAARLKQRGVVYGALAGPLAAAVLLVPFAANGVAHPLEGLDGETAKWREAYAAFGPKIQPDDCLLISVPLVSFYYLHRRPDYLLLNVLIRDSGRELTRAEDGFYRDWYSGQPLVTDAAEMETVFAKHPKGWIVVDGARFAYDNCVPADVREMIVKRCRQWQTPDSSVLVFSWGQG